MIVVDNLAISHYICKSSWYVDLLRLDFQIHTMTYAYSHRDSRMPTVKYAVCTYMHLFMSMFEFTVQSAIVYRIYMSIDYIGIGTSGQGGVPQTLDTRLLNV